MREMTWPDLPDLAGEILNRDGLRVTCAQTPGALLISGDLDAALAALAPDAPMLGLGGQTTGGDWAARIARDRALLVTAAPVQAAPGWHAGGYGVAAADDLFVMFTLAGPHAAQVLAEGTAADIGAGSPSAAVLFAGLTCLVLRRDEAPVILAEAPQAWALAEWLKGAAL